MYAFFNRYYFAHLDKQAVVLDERFNGGGYAADYIIDSDEQREEFKYFIGYDFLERLNLYFWGDRWYDNGHARIYKRIAHE